MPRVGTDPCPVEETSAVNVFALQNPGVDSVAWAQFTYTSEPNPGYHVPFPRRSAGGSRQLATALTAPMASMVVLLHLCYAFLMGPTAISPDRASARFLLRQQQATYHRCDPCVC